jgi:predicted Zn-dependent protease
VKKAFLKENFQSYATKIFSELKSGEKLALNLQAESTEFCRLNASKIRQFGDVYQGAVTLSFSLGSKKIKRDIPYTGLVEQDLKTAEESLTYMRSQITKLSDDPFYIPVVNNGKSDLDLSKSYIDSQAVMNEILPAIKHVDCAGIWASGDQYRATMNSEGESHWFKTNSFYFNYSLYTEKQKAVKGNYADQVFNLDVFKRNIEKSVSELELLERPDKILPRGSYRTYLAPDAVLEILKTLGWGSFGLGNVKRGNSGLKHLYEGTKSLSSKFNLDEDFSLGLNAPFNSLGELAPQKLALIEKGKLSNLLVSSRSAKEYNVSSNGAENGEASRSLSLHPGILSEKDVLKTLGTGLYINNLHYLNWSDVPGGRFTGMTRFASFWVENGEIVAPIKDLRFDETIYRVFGENLVELTKETEIGPNLYSYEKRGMGGSKTPGMLVNDFTFTL